MHANDGPLHRTGRGGGRGALSLHGQPRPAGAGFWTSAACAALVATWHLQLRCLLCACACLTPRHTTPRARCVLLPAEHLGSGEHYTLQRYLSIGEYDGRQGPEEVYREAMDAIFKDGKDSHRFPQLRWSKRHPGKFRWVLYEMWPLTDPVTQARAVLVCEQNISQVKALEEQIKKQNQRWVQQRQGRARRMWHAGRMPIVRHGMEHWARWREPQRDWQPACKHPQARCALACLHCDTGHARMGRGRRWTRPRGRNPSGQAMREASAAGQRCAQHAS